MQHPDVFSEDWFDKHQSKLLRFANTYIGRRFFYIYGDRSSVGKNRITRIAPNFIEWNKENRKVAEFRTHAKFSKRLYYGLKPFWHILHFWDMKIANNLSPSLNAGFDSLTVRPVPGTTVDGSVGRDSVNEIFNDIVSGNGNNSDDVSSTIFTLLEASSTSDSFEFLYRGIILFDTSPIGNGNFVNSATLSLYGKSKTTNLGSNNIHIVTSNPNSNISIENADYGQLGSISLSNSISSAGFSTSNYNNFLFNSNGIPTISKAGISKFGTRLGWDLDGSFTGSWSNGVSTSFDCFSSNETGTSKDPKLVVQYLPIVIELTGTSSMSGTASVIHYLSISGAFGFSGSVSGIIEVDNEATERKTYMYKIYDLDDNFIGIWDDVISVFNYSQEVNSAGASTYVRLARNSDSLTTTTENLLDSDDETIDDSDDRPIQTTVQSRNQIGPGSTVNHNYRVDVFVFYGELSPILDSNGAPILDSDDNPILGQSGAPNGRRLFTGFISEIESKYGDDETTLVELTSFGFDLDQYVIEDAGLTTVPFNSYDPSDIVSEAMADFNSREGIMNVTAQSVETTGTTVSYTFRVNTYLEVLQKSVELAPSDWFWYADLGQNLIYFRERPSTPSHLFYLGAHLENLKLRSYIGDAVNDVYFSGGEIDDDPVTNLFKRYTQTPATNTRVGLSRLNDNRVILEDSAEILSEGEMDRNNRIQYRSEITILSKVYDIEDISLGDLIGFRNFDNYVDLLTMQIVKIDYTPEKVTLALDTLLPRVSKRLADLKRNLDALENENNPTAPTV